MTPEQLYEALLPQFQVLLEQNWEHILIGGRRIQDRYGVTLETLLKNGCGYIPAGFPLAETICKLGMEQSHVLTTQGHSLLTWEKQLRDTRPFFEGRVVFSYRNNGKIIYWSGRETDATPSDHPMQNAKYLHQRSPSGGRPLYLEPQRETYMVEGHFHALILRQHGFTGVGIGARMPSDNQAKALGNCDRIFWIPDVDVLAPKKAGMKANPDGSQRFVPGRTTEEALADLLPTMRRLPQTRVCMYPAEFCSTDKGDLNDFFLKYTLDDFVGMLTSALDPDEIEVRSIPANVSAQERAAKLEQFARNIWQRTPVETNALVNHLARHLKLSKDEVRYLRERLGALRSTGVAKEGAESLATQHRKIYPGMDYVDGVLYYTVSRRTMIQKRVEGELVELVEETPWQISSMRELFPATEVELARRRLYFARGTDTKGSQLIWDDSSDTKWAIPDFIEHAAKPDTAELYAELRQYFKTYLHLTEEEYYDVTSLFVILSYCVQMFNTSPILGVNGIKGSGKTRLLDLLDTTAFNSQMTSSSSPPFVYRFVESCNGMLILDEQEKLHSIMKTRDQIDDLSLILNSCYKKGASVGRVIGEDQTPHPFRVYTTAVVANQNGFYPTLASRMIILPLIKPDKSVEIPHWDRIIGQRVGGAIKQKLFCWVLSHVADIQASYDRFCTELVPLFDYVGLRHRERECWIALFSLALTIDELCGRPFRPDKENRFPRKGHHLLADLLDAQSSLTKRKNEMMNSDEQFALLLAALRDIVKAYEEGEYAPVQPVNLDSSDLPESQRSYWYSVKDLTADLNRRQGLEFFPAKQGQKSLGSVLRKGAVIAEDELRTKVRVGSDRMTILRLSPKSIAAACDRFDVPDSVSPEYVDKPNKSNE